jgi:hypothetical protein
MWKITISPPRFADKNLASISLECPTNLRSTAELGLLLALWCGRAQHVVKVKGDSIPFNFGFFAGELVIEPKDAYIKNEGRLSVEAGRTKIAQSENEQTDKKGKLGADLGLNLASVFGFGKMTGEVGGHLERVASRTERIDDEYYRVYWRLADAGFNSWRVFGFGLNPENILEYKVIGDAPICFVAPCEGVAAIEVNVTYRCDLRDLWFEADKKNTPRKDWKLDKDREKRNREAVSACVIARALNRHSGQLDAGNGLVVLARQRLRALTELHDRQA